MLTNYYIETYGCAANRHDSDVIIGILEKSGFHLTDRVDNADVLIINTCIVKKATEDKMRERLRKLSKLNKPLIVAGCMAEALPNLIEKLAPQASMLSPHHLDELPDALPRILNGEKIILRGIKKLDRLTLPRKHLGGAAAPVTISQGCLGACTFCITKFARGHLSSYPIDHIIDEIKRLISSGVKEIQLTGQDTGSYGVDIDSSLPELLEAVNEIDGKFMVRLGMANPDTIYPVIDDVLDVFQKSEKFYHYFHIPVQSGSDRILKSMRRRYTVQEYIDIVKKIRNRLGEDTTLATDIIVAYPGETESDVDATIELLEVTKPDIVNVSRYGDRPFTVASKIYPKIHSGVAKMRSIKVTRVVRRISLERNLKYLNSKVRAFLLENSGNSRVIGRTFNYKKIVANSNHNVALGEWKSIIVQDVTWKTLYGKVIE